MIEAYFDGCCEPVNPGGNASYGAILLVEGVPVWQASQAVPAPPGGLTSNNVAEYSGFIAVAQQLLAMPSRRTVVIIRGDSKLVVEQLHGRWRVKGGHYIPFHRTAKALWKKLKKHCPGVRLEWIPREANGLADALSKKILIDQGVQFKLQPLESA